MRQSQVIHIYIYVRVCDCLRLYTYTYIYRMRQSQVIHLRCVYYTHIHRCTGMRLSQVVHIYIHIRVCVIYDVYVNILYMSLCKGLAPPLLPQKRKIQPMSFGLSFLQSLNSIDDLVLYVSFATFR